MDVKIMVYRGMWYTNTNPFAYLLLLVVVDENERTKTLTTPDCENCCIPVTGKHQYYQTDDDEGQDESGFQKVGQTPGLERENLFIRGQKIKMSECYNFFIFGHHLQIFSRHYG
jgi:hypothetical protein